MGPVELVIVLLVLAVIATPILLFVRVMQGRRERKERGKP